MLKPPPEQLAQVIQRQLRQCWEQGFMKPNEDGHLVPPFPPADIVGLHTHKLGVGDGVWFRLEDGRVFNGFFELDDTDPALYDTVDN